MNLKPIGLHGCYCHPYKDWAECDHEHKKKLKLGQKVRNRHTLAEGVVNEVYPPPGNYYIIKYGPLPRDLHLNHAANLILLDSK